MTPKEKQIFILRTAFITLGIVFIAMGAAIAFTNLVPIKEEDTRHLLGGVFGFMGCMEFVLAFILPARIVGRQKQQP